MSMPISPRQIADVISVICDAVHRLVVEEDVPGAVRRLEEAAGGLHADLTDREAEGDGLSHALRAVKTLAHALEAPADEKFDLVEVHVRTAVDALSASVHRLSAGYGEETSGVGNAIQFSVAEALRVPNQEAIRDALRNLATRTEPDAFVILLDADTGKFIQFIGSKDRPIILEIPLASLSEEGIARAEHFFDGEGYRRARDDESFSITVERDVDSGARLAMDIFMEVFRSPEDFSLKIEEN